MDQNTTDQIRRIKKLVFQGIRAFPSVKVHVYAVHAFCSVNLHVYAAWSR